MTRRLGATSAMLGRTASWLQDSELLDIYLSARVHFRGICSGQTARQGQLEGKANVDMLHDSKIFQMP